MLQDTYQVAAKFAAEKHANQQVKGGKANYMLHVSNVAMEIMMAYQEESNFDLIQAVKIALLHDTIEDTDTTFDEVASLFGEETAQGVQSLTKDVSLPEEEQMKDSLHRIIGCTKEAKLVKIADRIANLQKPPKGWSQEKIRSYYEQSQLIYDELHGEHSFLDKRLKSKIENYKSYIKM